MTAGTVGRLCGAALPAPLSILLVSCGGSGPRPAYGSPERLAGDTIFTAHCGGQLSPGAARRCAEADARASVGAHLGRVARSAHTYRAVSSGSAERVDVCVEYEAETVTYCERFGRTINPTLRGSTTNSGRGGTPCVARP